MDERVSNTIFEFAQDRVHPPSNLTAHIRIRPNGYLCHQEAPVARRVLRQLDPMREHAKVVSGVVNLALGEAVTSRWGSVDHHSIFSDGFHNINDICFLHTKVPAALWCHVRAVNVARYKDDRNTVLPCI